jgi:aspartyl/asparaginyl-tRNA synthetase
MQDAEHKEHPYHMLRITITYFLQIPPPFSYSSPNAMEWMKVKDALKAPIGTQLTVKGWVRTRRDSKADGGISFLAVSDGTCFDHIQVVAKNTLDNYPDEIVKITSGCSVEVDGELVESAGRGQDVEILAGAVRVAGWVDNPDSYPVSAKPGHPSFLRPARFLLRAHAHHHRRRLRGRRRDVPGQHPGPAEPAA